MTTLVDLSNAAALSGEMGYALLGPEDSTPRLSLTTEHFRPPAIIVIEGSAPAWARQMVKGMNHLIGLPAGWDGYGGAPLHVDAAVAGLVLLGNMKFEGPVPHVAASPDGDLMMEWDRPEVELTIEVSPRGDVVVLRDEEEWGTGLDGDSNLRLALKHLAASVDFSQLVAGDDQPQRLPLPGETVLWRRVPGDHVKLVDDQVRPDGSSFRPRGDENLSVVVAELQPFGPDVLAASLDAGVAQVTVQDFIDRGAQVFLAPEEGIPGHAEVVGHLTKGQMKDLSKLATWVHTPPAPEAA